MSRFYVYGFIYDGIKNEDLASILRFNGVSPGRMDKGDMIDSLRLIELGDNGIKIPERMFVPLFLRKKIENPETGGFVVVHNLTTDLPKVKRMCNEDSPCEIVGKLNNSNEFQPYKLGKPLPPTKAPRYFESEITEAEPMPHRGWREEERSEEEESGSDDDGFIVPDENPVEEEGSYEPSDDEEEEEEEPVRGRTIRRPEVRVPVRSRSPVKSEGTWFSWLW